MSLPSPDYLKGLLAAARPVKEAGPSSPVLLGKYRLIREIARGAMGIVHEAEDTELKRTVAVKVLQEAIGTNEEFRRRFQREALSAAKISHPHVVRVYDAGEMDGRLFLVMELVQGRPLRDLLEERALEMRQRVELLEKVSRGVAAAHAEGIVHRDLKPSNILVTGQGEPKVGDFGLAHWIHSESKLTRSGTPIGTPAYMAPEQVEGGSHPISPATDVFALGAILYEMLAGRTPHSGDSVMELYGRIVQDEPAPPRKANNRIPWDLQTICLKALEKDPGRRYPDAKEFADDLRRQLNGEPIHGEPPGMMSRGVKWVRHHRTVAAVGALVLVIAPVVALLAHSLVRGKEEQRRLSESTKLLEIARLSLDRIARSVYDAKTSHADLEDRVDEARRRIEEAITLAPDLPAGHYHLGRAWDLAGDTEKAEREWLETIRLEPGFGPAHFHLGRWLVMKSFAASIPSRAEDPDRTMKAGSEIAREAIRHLNLAREQGGGPGDALDRDAAEVMLAYLSRSPGLTDLIRTGIERNIKVEGAEVFHWMRGVASTDPAERFAALDQALAIHPGFEWAYFTRGVIHSQADQWESPEGDRHERIMGHWRQADADFTRQLKVNPRSPIAHIALAQRALARFNLRRHAEALEDSTEALRRDGSYVDAILTRGEARRGLKQFREALPDYSAVIAAAPRCVEAWEGRAMANWALQDRPAALRDFDEVLRIDPERVPTYKERGAVRLELKDFEGALRDCDEAWQRGSRDLWVLYTKGCSLEGLHRRKEAIETFRTALDGAEAGWPRRADVEERLRKLSGEEY